MTGMHVRLSVIFIVAEVFIVPLVFVLARRFSR